MAQLPECTKCGMYVHRGPCLCSGCAFEVKAEIKRLKAELYAGEFGQLSYRQIRERLLQREIENTRMVVEIERLRNPTQHAGDCTIYAAMCNECATDGICTCGYGWSRVREGNWDSMFSAERNHKRENHDD